MQLGVDPESERRIRLEFIADRRSGRHRASRRETEKRLARRWGVPPQKIHKIIWGAKITDFWWKLK